MVLSWSLIEILRYPIYAISLLGLFQPPSLLIWLRYSAFFVLYPIGAVSEAGLIYSTLPGRHARWGVADVARALVFTIQAPSEILLSFSGLNCSDCAIYSFIRDVLIHDPDTTKSSFQANLRSKRERCSQRGEAQGAVILFFTRMEFLC
jgi:hypothetical protein